MIRAGLQEEKKAVLNPEVVIHFLVKILTEEYLGMIIALLLLRNVAPLKALPNLYLTAPH